MGDDNKTTSANCFHRTSKDPCCSSLQTNGIDFCNKLVNGLAISLKCDVKISYIVPKSGRSLIGFNRKQMLTTVEGIDMHTTHLLLCFVVFASDSVSSF